MASAVLYTFTGTVPSKKNGRRWIQRGKRRYSVPSATYELWERSHRAALRARFGPLNLTNYTLELWFYLPDNRVRDLDNILTSILDCLKTATVIADDRWQFMAAPPILNQPQIDAHYPRVEIRIAYQNGRMNDGVLDPSIR
jgi:Holliday junction resolvase RusA-like endonuclease